MVLAAGKPDEDIATLLSSSRCRELQASGQLLIRTKFHNDETEARVFSAANVVWLGYIGGAYGSSGILYQAGSASLPVISTVDDLIGLAVRTHKLGIALDAAVVASVADAIRRLRQDDSLLRDFGENGRRIARSHTGTSFATSICDALVSGLHRDSDNEGPRDRSS
jgi:glycosyltransferase involved in cell wall biosynthesis